MIELDLSGVLCATITPFLPGSLEVDWAGVRSNSEWLIERGIRLLVVNGSIAENASLSIDEQVRAVRETVQAAAGRATIIAGCSHTNPRTSLELCQSAAEAGASGVMLLPPYYFRLSADEALDFYRWIDSSTELPFLVYDNPATGRVELPPETIEAIAGLPRFAGLKEASQDVSRFYGLIRRFGGRFPVIAAVEDPLLFMLVAGAKGCMTAAAAFAPELLARLVAAVDSSDLASARDLFGRLSTFRDLFAADIRAGRPAYLAYTKAAVELVGGRAGPTRPPLRSLGAHERGRLRAVLEQELGLTLGAAGSAGRRASPDRQPQSSK